MQVSEKMIEAGMSASEAFDLRMKVGDMNCRCSLSNDQVRSVLEAALAAAEPGPVTIELDGVADAIAYGKGFWRSCSGCHETNEGVPLGPFSDVLKCHLGMGCFECGGIGAIWDTTDYADMGLALSAEEPWPVAIPEDIKTAAYNALHDACMCFKPQEQPSGWYDALAVIESALLAQRTHPAPVPADAGAVEDADRLIDKLAAMPCETTGIEDYETGCCRTCRARHLAALRTAQPAGEGELKALELIKRAAEARLASDIECMSAAIERTFRYIVNTASRGDADDV